MPKNMWVTKGPEFLKLRGDGVTLKEAAKRLGVSVATAANWSSKKGKASTSGKGHSVTNLLMQLREAIRLEEIEKIKAKLGS